MANVYVRSGAVGTGTGASWVNAYTTLAAAFTAKAAGDNFWVSEDHAESSASINLQSPGTAAAPCTAICVSHTGTVPPVSADLRTTATFTSSGGTNLTIGNGSERCYYYGISFSVGAARVDIAQGTAAEISFEACIFVQTGTGRADFVRLGATTIPSIIYWKNCQLNVAGTDVGVDVRNGKFIWRDTATPVAVNTYPTILVNLQTGATDVLLEGLDLSASGFNTKSIFSFNSGATGVAANATIQTCKLHSGLNLYLTAPDPSGGAIYTINCDSGATNYKHGKLTYQGSQIVETTIVRTGGATDGTTPISWKIVTGADANGLFPYRSIPLAIWNDTTAANVTVTVYGIWGGGAVPTNADIAMEVSYLGTSGSPIATINNSNGKADYLAAATNQSTDASTWGGSTTKFKMAVTLSSPQPAMKGLIYVTVKAAAASSTFYIDPKIVLS